MVEYEIEYSPELKAINETSQVRDNVAEHNSKQEDNPQYKVIVPQYMYKPAWGFPRYQPLGLLRQLGKNVYASSVFKAIKDVIIDTPRKVVFKEGVESTPELEEKRKKYELFFERPNPEETFATFARKVMDDLFKYDSGVINKVYNPLGEVIQLRAAPGDTFKKNPNKHGYLDERDELILDKTPSNKLVEAAKNPKTLDNSFANTSAFQFYTQFIDRAAYFQFVNSVASQIPIPYGKKEICWLTTNPSTDNVYTNGAPLEDAIDLILTLVYGLKFNLDFYANGNTPEGIVNAVGATKKDLKKIKDQLDMSVTSPRDAFGLKRRIGYRMPVVNMDNLDFIKLNLTSKEMEILDQQKWFTKILWMRFGLNADEMGFTEDSNRATGVQQNKNSIRKAIRPIYTLFEECFTYDVLSEFEDGELMKFEFDMYDPLDQKPLRDLQEQEIRMGISSPQMIMDKEGIDVKEIMQHKKDNMEFEFQSVPGQESSENNFSKQKESNDKEQKNPSTKSYTATSGGEGTEDSVMNPIEKPKQLWYDNKGFNNGDELINYLMKKDKRLDIKADDEPPSEDEEDDKSTETKVETQEELVLESPIEKVMKAFISKVDAKNKELIKESEK